MYILVVLYNKTQTLVFYGYKQNVGLCANLFSNPKRGNRILCRASHEIKYQRKYFLKVFSNYILHC